MSCEEFAKRYFYEKFHILKYFDNNVTITYGVENEKN